MMKSELFFFLNISSRALGIIPDPYLSLSYPNIVNVFPEPVCP